MTAPAKSTVMLNAERRAEFVAARNVYVVIIASFLVLCTIAIIMTTRMEAQRTGFHPIETSKPMSFIDKTYLKKKAP